MAVEVDRKEDTTTSSDEDADGEIEEDEDEVVSAQDEEEEESSSSEADADADADVDDEESDDKDRFVDAKENVREDAPEPVVKAVARTRRKVEDEEGSASEQESESDSESDSESADAEGEWEAESDTAENKAGIAAETVDPNSCIYCGEDEEHDPSEDFEEYLACSVCGDNAHQQCARSAKAMEPDQDVKTWRCSACVANGVMGHRSLSPESPDEIRRSSAPKLARDLLPAVRGTEKPDSHSIFNALIIEDTPRDGSRALRKRKASVDAEESVRAGSRKRQRRVDIDNSEAGASSASRPNSRGEHALTAAAAAANTELGEEISVRPRPRRQRKIEKPLVSVVDSDGISLIVSFNLDPTRVKMILSQRPRKRRIRDKTKKIAPVVEEEHISHYPSLQMTSFTPFYAFTEKEGDEAKKPYGGILSETEANTEKTFPQAIDRKKFEDARQKAEADWRRKLEASNANAEPARPTPKVAGPPSKIKSINFGGYEIDTWHAAPYPEEYSRNKVLYICEFCLKYMSSDYVAWRHKLKCPAKHPPGDEIYRDGTFSFFEVDGRKNPVYCQNLCLLAKLFLGSKTLYYDVEPFLFYIMTENDEYGCHFVGYFSKEKRPSSLNNVSCILVLPIHQRRGFGHLLIDFSYLLTRVEEKTGSPEKPLSDMGLVSYRSYWRLVLCYQLIEQQEPLSIARLSERTGMTADDIVSALEGLRALVRDPITKSYALRLDLDYFREFIANYEKKGYVKLNPDALIWVPYVMGRGAAAHDEPPAIQTVAPREGDAEETVASEDMMSNLNGGIATPLVEVSDALAVSVTDVDVPMTNGVDVEAEEGSLEVKPPAQSPRPKSGPSTPLPNGVNGHSHNASMTSSTSDPMDIPPSRFEIFPPLPGTAHRRRTNRPFGTRSSSYRSPGRTRSSLHSPGVQTPTFDLAKVASGGNLTIRRQRSRMEQVFSGGDDDGDDAGEEENDAKVAVPAGEKDEDDEEEEEEDDDEKDADGEVDEEESPVKATAEDDDDEESDEEEEEEQDDEKAATADEGPAVESEYEEDDGEEEDEEEEDAEADVDADADVVLDEDDEEDDDDD